MGVFLSRFAAIVAPTPVQPRYALVLQSTPLATESACRDASPLAVGQLTFLPAEFLEIPLALRFGNLSQKHGAQERAPEDGPVFIVTTHRF
jgi:hypothetical protein